MLSGMQKPLLGSIISKIHPIYKNLVGAYTFQERVSPWTHNYADPKTHGNLSGCVWGVDRFGSCLKFETSQFGLLLPFSENWEFGAGDFTIAWWENRTYDWTTGVSMARHATSGEDGIVPFLIGYAHPDLSDNRTRGLRITSNGDDWNMVSEHDAFGPTVLNELQHLALTRINGTFHCYLNANETYTDSSTTDAIFSSLSSFNIGGWRTYYGAWGLEGLIDGLYIWKGRGLRQQEIQQLVHKPFDLFEPQYDLTRIKTAEYYTYEGNVVISLTPSHLKELDKTGNVTISLTPSSYVWIYGGVGDVTITLTPSHTKELDKTGNVVVELISSHQKTLELTRNVQVSMTPSHVMEFAHEPTGNVTISLIPSHEVLAEYLEDRDFTYESIPLPLEA